MSYQLDQTTNEIVISGFENGIAPSPYKGIGNIRNLNTSYYPGSAYVNYRRQACTLSEIDENWYAGTNSINVSNNIGWTFSAPVVTSMANPVQHAQSPAGLNYVLDTNGNIWKQSAVNSSTFNLLEGGIGRIGSGSGGLAYWNNYLVVFGDGLIEFCGDGTGDTGITSANWNVNSNNFFQNKTTVEAQVYSLTSNPSGSTYTGGTFASSYTWQYPSTTTATVILSTGQTIINCAISNGNSTFSCASTVITGSPSTLIFITSPGLLYFPTNISVSTGQQIVFSTTGTLPSPLVAGQVYYATSNSTTSVQFTGGQIFTVSATPDGTNITLTSQGTGTQSFSISPKTVLPIGNVTNLTFTGDLSAGNTSATISSYTLPNGATVSTLWFLPTGIYNLIDSNGNNILTAFTNASSNVTFPSSISEYATGNYSVQLLNPSVSNRVYVSKVDGNLYFINGATMGALIIAQSNVVFSPADAAAYAVNYSVFELATGANAGSDSIIDMTDLSDSMIVAGQNKIYSWDYTSSFTASPVPIPDTPIKRVLNNLNIVYVFAGQKGNIYTSNGSYAQLLTKIPDYIAGAIDPVWTYGGVMTHRSKVFFQALAQDTSGNNLLAGIFSVIVSPSILGEVSQGIVMEAQNSAGLIPASGSLGNGILMDNEPSSNGQDSYYSAYSTGATTGAIDFNDTSVWQNYEPVIETDIIPVGSFLNKQTLGQTQFKLDRPMVSGDKMRLYGRASLSDSWTLIGTTTTTTLSDAYPSNLAQIQWMQYQIQFSGASSGSSRLPLTEMRVQVK